MPTPKDAPYKIAQRTFAEKFRYRARFYFMNGVDKNGNTKIYRPNHILKRLAVAFNFKFYGKHKAKVRKWINANESLIMRKFPEGYSIWK